MTHTDIILHDSAVPAVTPRVKTKIAPKVTPKIVIMNTVSEAPDFDVPDILADYPVIHQQSVQWGEIDAFKHLNNVVYYRYAESARITYLQALDMFASGITILAQSSCQYLRSVLYPDTLLLGVRCQRLGNTSITMEYCYYSVAQQAVAARGNAVLVRFDSNGKQKKPWTDAESERFLALEAAFGHTPEY